MADMQSNQQPWEDQWQQAFEGAETPPPDHVWKNIEGELAVRETGKYRRGFLLYRAVAAVLLLLIAGLTWYIVVHQSTTNPRVVVDLENASGQIEQSPQVPTASLPNLPHSGSTSTDQSVADNVFPTDPLAVVAPQTGKVSSSSSSTVGSPVGSAPVSESRAEAADNAPRFSSKGSHIAAASDEVAQAPPPTATGQSQLAYAKPSVATVAPVVAEKVADASPQLLPDQAQAVLYRVPQIPTVSAEKERAPLSLFAGLSLAPGYFDPQFQLNASDFGAVALSPSPSASPRMFEMSNADGYQTPASSATIGVENTPELSFTYGVDVGMRLSDHWVVESGVDYNRFSTSTASRWVVADVASGQRYAFVATNANTLANNLNQAPNISTALNNAYEFIAVPLKVGYRRSVSKFQFTVSSGVAANFFLRNAISASSAASELSTYTISASETGSPFNNVYYSGLLSGGVNYNVLGQYYLSLTPTYAFALTPLTRVDSNLRSNPYSFGVNVGFQYQF